MRRRIRRVTGKAGHCAEQPCAGCGDLPKLQGRARCRGRAVFVRCVLRWQRGRNARARARRNRARTRARGHTMDFCGRRGHRRGRGAGGAGKGAGTGAHCGFFRQARAHNGFFAAGAGTGIQRAFLQQARGHGHTAGPRGGALRLTLGRAYALAPGGFFPCGKKITRRQAR